MSSRRRASSSWRRQRGRRRKALDLALGLSPARTERDWPFRRVDLSAIQDTGVGGGEFLRRASLGGGDAECDGEVALADAWWSERAGVAALFEEVEPEEFGHQLAVESGLEVESLFPAGAATFDL